MPRPFGPYTIIEEIGRGAMGVVYRARHQGLPGRDVALKVLSPDRAADPTAVARFRREMAAAAAVEHPGIVPVHDAGVESGYPYYVMAFIRGTSLDRYLAGRPPCDPEALRIVADVGRALAAAHRAGVIHRDVKPSNILVDEAGRALLTDFGLARVVDHKTRLTRTGDVVGTPLYMAPEQILQPGAVDLRADIFSLGCVLWHAATGEPAFRAPSVALILEAVRRGCPPIPQEVPAGVAAILDRSLAPVPADRYPTADDLANDIEAYLAGKGPKGPGRRSSRVRALGVGGASVAGAPGGGSRARAIVLAAGFVGSAVLGLAAFWLVRSQGASETEARLHAAAERARPSVEQGERLLAAGAHGQALVALDEGIACLSAAGVGPSPGGTEDAASEASALYARALAARGLARLAAGDPVAADADLRRAIDVAGPAPPPSLSELRARLDIRAGRPADALRVLSEVPSGGLTAPLEVLLGEAALDASRPDVARAALDRLDARGTLDDDLRRRAAILRCRVLLAEGAAVEAAGAAAAEIDRGENADLRLIRAAALLDAFGGDEDPTGILGPAAADASHVAGGTDGDPSLRREALRLLGRIYARAGLAAEVASTLAGLDLPDDASSDLRALALARAGDVDQAAEVAATVGGARGEALSRVLAADRALLQRVADGDPDPLAAVEVAGLAAEIDPAGPYRRRGLTLAQGDCVLRTDEPNPGDEDEGRCAEAAARFLYLALRRSPEDAASRLALARVLVRRLRLGPAVVEARRARDLAPEDPLAHLTLGEALARTRDAAACTDALAALDRAQALGGLREDVLRLRARALLGAGRAADALAASDEAIAACRWHWSAYALRAEILDALGRRDEAAAVRQFLDGGGFWDMESALYRRIRGLMGEGGTNDTARLRQSFPLLEEVAATHRARGFDTRGDGHFALRETGLAMLDYGRAIEVHPSSVINLGTNIRVRGIDRGPPVEALAGVFAGPPEAGLAELIGGCQRLAVLFTPSFEPPSLPPPDVADEACRLLTHSLDRRPGRVAALLLRGLAHLSAGRPAWAEDDLRTALLLAPDDDATAAFLAACLAARGRSNEAADVLRAGSPGHELRHLARWPWFRDAPELRALMEELAEHAPGD